MLKLEFLNSKILGGKYANNIFVGDFLSGNLYYFEVNATRTGLKMSLSGTGATGFNDGVTDAKANYL